MTITSSEAHCATLLRQLRQKKGLTLEQFETFSKGRIKSVVLGSYERGTRAISIARLDQLAKLYEVPLSYFFTTTEMVSDLHVQRFIFDLRRVNLLDGLDERLLPVRKFLSLIVHRRRDWNGEVISIRRSDSENLALISDISIADLTPLMISAGFLFTEAAKTTSD
jgi:transcriptional regulator with XRE-family HTH domain